MEHELLPGHGLDHGSLNLEGKLSSSLLNATLIHPFIIYTLPKKYNSSACSLPHCKQLLWHCCYPLSPLAEYWMAVTATWWGCSFISISEEESRKILRVPSLYPAATQALSLLEEGLQHTQPQAWPTERNRRGYYVKDCKLCTLQKVSRSFSLYWSWPF